MTKTMVELPTIRTYGNYSSDNYGAHALCVTVGPVTVWYSYKTPVAFRVNGHERVVRVNSWRQTTGKHLNAIDGGAKKSRVSSEDFKRLWNEQVSPILGS